MMITPSQSAPAPAKTPRLGPLDVLLLSAWCGLAAGELEVAARLAYRALSTTNRLYTITRHFVWLVPSLELLALSCHRGPSRAGHTALAPRTGWLSPRLLCFLTILPMLLLAGRQIHPAAWCVFAMGVATSLAPLLERHATHMRRWLLLTIPAAWRCVLIQAGVTFCSDRVKEWRQSGRPAPPSGSPNVLLIVLDTVRADHLSLYGHSRPTSTTLERLARKGVRFDRARAAAPWTLASHASLFTGRRPHELNVRWMHPLADGFLTLAEYLGSRGYATAGFVGNTFYCAYDSGLNRGFTHYEDYSLGKLDALRTVHLIDLALKAVPPILTTLGRFLPVGPSLSLGPLMLRQVAFSDRKDAAAVSREFLHWLAGRPARERPFFAFLNYADAHAP